MAERPIDVRSGAVVLRRRWRILVFFGVLGLVLGLTYGFLAPVQLTSRSIVLIAPGSGASGDSGGEIDTQVQLVLSRPVLEKAGKSVTPTLTADQVEQRITVAAQTAQLIRIEASSPRGAQAQALSQAVAQSFVDTVADNVRSVTGNTVKELNTRQDALTGQVKDLEQQITVVQQRRGGESSRSGAGTADARLEADLTVQQSDLVLQLDRVKAELEATQSSPGSSPTISIVQPAAPARGPGRLPALVSWSVVGAFVGLCLAGFAAVVRARRDPRLRARDDVADALGTSVLVDVRSRPQHSVGEWSALLESYEASAVDAWAFRQLLRLLSDARGDSASGRNGMRRRWGRIDHPTSLAVISFSGDKKGLAVGPQLAAFSASLGVTTRIVIATGDDSCASLMAACSVERDRPLRPNLILEARSKGPEAQTPGVGRSPAGSLDELLRGLVLTEHPQEPTETAFGTEADEARSAPDEAGATGEAAEASGTDVHVPAGTAARTDADDGVASPAGGTGEGDGRRAGGEGDLVPLAAWARGRADDTGVVPKHASTSLTIVLAVVNRKNPNLHEVPPTDTTVLAISPGVGTREELARLAVAVDDTGRWLDGVVLTDPDSTDRTTGRHTLEERARQTPLPLRATGVSPSTAVFNDRG